MLHINKIGASSSEKDAAVAYFCDLGSEDYYLEGGEPPGIWHGRGAARLGLEGSVDKEVLRDLFDGRHPRTGEQLVQPRIVDGKDVRRPGHDLTFSAPKTVSAVWAVADEELRNAISQAQLRAVETAMEHITEQGGLELRYGQGGKVRRPADELIWATFEHSTSRAQDPQLHTHTLLINMAGKEAAWGALESNRMHQMRAEAAAIYRSTLAAEMQRQGFAIERAGANFEVVGVQESLTQKWSTRAEEIREELRRQGVNSYEASSAAAKATREDKGEVARPILYAGWEREAAEHGFTKQHIEAMQRGEFEAAEGREPRALSIDELIADIEKSESTWTARDVWKRASISAQGVTDYEGIRRQVEQVFAHERVVTLGYDDRGEKRFASRQMITKEVSTLEIAKRRMHERDHPVTPEAIQNALANSAAKGKPLNAEQKNALAHITQWSGSVTVVEGMAGAGKSTMLACAYEVWRDCGYRPRGMSLSGKAAEGLQIDSGMKSDTIHRLLIDLDSGRDRLTARDILVCDEAGLSDSVLTHALMQAANDAGAKLVLVGDRNQHQAVSAGGTFRAIGDAVGTANLVQIRRQREEWARDAVKDFSRGDAAAALAKLDERGYVHSENENRTEARYAMVRAWRDALLKVENDAADGKDLRSEHLLLAGSRADVRELNLLARTAMREDGRITGDDVHVDVEWGKGDEAEHYTLPFAAGDRVMFRQPEKRMLHVMNGTTGTLESVERGDDGIARFQVRLDKNEDGVERVVNFSEEDYRALTHGVAATSHKSQGMTVSWAALLYDERMIDKHMSFVGGSRARDATHVFAASGEKEDMAKFMSRDRTKICTTDYLGLDQLPAELKTEVERETARTPGRDVVYLPDFARDRGHEHGHGEPEKATAPEAAPTARAVGADYNNDQDREDDEHEHDD